MFYEFTIRSDNRFLNQVVFDSFIENINNSMRPVHTFLT